MPIEFPFPDLLPNVLLVVLSLALVILGFYLLIKLLQGVGWLLGRAGGFLGAMLADFGRLLGSGLAVPAFLAIIVVQALLSRDAQVRHYSRGMRQELALAGRAAYGLFLGNWLQLFGLRALGEGLERRLPEALATAPQSTSPRSNGFDGYTVVGNLPTGGSGARLYVARPDARKRANFTRAGRGEVTEVVIKSFALDDGSNLPEIVRESRALEFARNLGLVLEHGIDQRRFYYITPFVPGEDLGVVTARLHAISGPDGLNTLQLRHALGYVADLLETLDRYHRAGFWHKDVKPGNVIVAEGRAHLVDLGLLTPLRSTLTLTTHGTEYYRDPELVRQALKGARVTDVDGVRFDLYGVGALLFSVIENSFPGHGSLSPITKTCPEAVQWIIRRAMAELQGRYPHARAMLADVRAVMTAPDPFALKPAELPSLAGLRVEDTPPLPEPLS